MILHFLSSSAEYGLQITRRFQLKNTYLDIFIQVGTINLPATIFGSINIIMRPIIMVINT